MAYSTEEPRYSVVAQVGDIEIRHYEPVIQAVTSLPDSGHTSAGFRRLAGFIFGGNETGQEIPMTTPVQEKLVSGSRELAFTMPDGYSMEDLPRPVDSAVSLVEVPARMVAVISFSGWASAGKVKRYSSELREVVQSEGIAIVSEPMLNRYNPPWTPPFLRRNEIMVEIEETALAGA